MPFSRGTRQCIGINLAYAEIYLTLAMVFRSYGGAGKEERMKGDLGGLELFDTEWARDSEAAGDGGAPLTKGGRGVRVRVVR